MALSLILVALAGLGGLFAVVALVVLLLVWFVKDRDTDRHPDSRD